MRITAPHTGKKSRPGSVLRDAAGRTALLRNRRKHGHALAEETGSRATEKKATIRATRFKRYARP